ncbi:MAG TPA: adenylate/guanylate cyclase domain-containing protein [Acidimicrobiia bacterium]|nr:adenylate/guanylate cyclase domain-containing protein [Acidimicrobiia bacterium]
MPPQTQYAKSGDVSIAYQVTGGGSRDLVYVPGFVSNIEVMWDDPGLVGFLERLASFSRLITFDKRGTGVSDPVPPDQLPTLETRMDDLRAVMDAVGSARATLFGHSEGGNMCILFATTYPERTDGLILTGSYAKRIRSDEYPWAPTREERQTHIEEVERTWGNRGLDVEYYAPSRADDPAFVEWLARYARLSASPKAAAALIRMNSEIDVTSVLPLVRVPTLLLYRADDPDVSVEEGRYIASKVPDARLVELAGGDHFFWAGDTEPLIEEIEEFMTGHRTPAPSDRVLATVLFTDIVGSTEMASAKGDQAWLGLLDRHHRLIRAQLARWRGREENTAGDGFLATFDGPARAIRCARTIAADVKRLGLEVRCGLHTGEIEIRADGVGGLAVHIGARIAALAGPGEVLVSRTVRDLVSGAGLEFAPRGSHTLKGVSEPWELFAVVGG